MALPVVADSDSRNSRWCRAYESTSADHFSSWLWRVVAFGWRVKNGGKWYSRGNSKAGGPEAAAAAAAAGFDEEVGGIDRGDVAATAVAEVAWLGFSFGWSVVVVVVVVGSGDGEGEGEGDADVADVAEADAAAPSPGDDVAEDCMIGLLRYGGQAVYQLWTGMEERKNLSSSENKRTH